MKHAIVFAALSLAAVPVVAIDDFAVALPDGVHATWELGKAFTEDTGQRARICINGLWRWQPARDPSDVVPNQNWGFFKVPGCWPGITDYMQKDCQTVFAHPSWRTDRLSGVKSAWYEREVTIPELWNGRRIALSVETLNSLAAVYIDGQKVGDLAFPGGELDLTSSCRPGRTHRLSMLVTAVPLKGVMLSYNDTNSARQVQGSVARRGLCGDVFLLSTPVAGRITGVQVSTSVERRQIAVAVTLANLEADRAYSVAAHITQRGTAVREFAGEEFQGAGQNERRVSIAADWLPDSLWDLHTPQNQYEITVLLRDAEGKPLDVAFPERFGFREFVIKGRDFYLNGSRVFLCAVPLDNAQVGAGAANYNAAFESLARLKAVGVNFVYTHNYGCEPGTHLSFSEILRAADDAGMLVAFSQPHFGQYDWQAPNADSANGYAKHAEFYVRQAQNHPSVMAYAMSHNATGYSEDMNPDMIDGASDPRSQGERNNTQRAMRAEAIVKRLDPGRIVYHHSSGNLGAMHTSNFYPNFCPIQELCDWFEHWATTGVKPVFTCEYGAPFSWDWAMYRGWYKGERSFGSARVPWDFCLSEWNAQFEGDAAYRTSDAEKANLRFEAKQFRAGNLWHRWDYPFDLNSKRFDERYPIMARYLTENWRAFRTWGVSAVSPWEHAQYWKLRDGVDRGRRELAVDWEQLQRPGLSPDYIEQRYERMDLAFDRGDWVATEAAEALERNNRPLLGYIAGKPAAFTSKDHNFLPGETIEKQLVVINNSRVPVGCDCSWSVGLPQPVRGKQTISVPTGDQARVPIAVTLPADLPPGRYEMAARFAFADGHSQEDLMAIDVLPRHAAQPSELRIALFDPFGETAALLRRLEVPFHAIDADSDTKEYDLLVVGKSSLTLDGPAPDLSRVRDGLRVIVFEQTAEVLEKRLGFRVAEYGLRQLFPRLPDHPLVAGLSDGNLRDWRGEATISSPRLNYQMRPRYGPTVEWCGIPVTRLWRCGNRGNVASVLIEKPARGDFLPIADGGYSLQYSPLLEYREGRGMILFCQLDVTGRTEIDPAADRCAINLITFSLDWKAKRRRTLQYAGDPAGRIHLESAGFTVEPFSADSLGNERILVAGPNAADTLKEHAAAIRPWASAGGHLLTIGLDGSELAVLDSPKITTTRAEHIASYFDQSSVPRLLRGIGPADVHNRDPRELPLVTGGATSLGDGVLASVPEMNIVCCQLVPWSFGGSNQPNLKKTYRRSSYLLTRILCNMGAAGSTQIVQRFSDPVDPAVADRRWLDGLYLDTPEEWDDPYRFFRW